MHVIQSYKGLFESFLFTFQRLTGPSPPCAEAAELPLRAGARRLLSLCWAVGLAKPPSEPLYRACGAPKGKTPGVYRLEGVPSRRSATCRGSTDVMGRAGQRRSAFFFRPKPGRNGAKSPRSAPLLGLKAGCRGLQGLERARGGGPRGGGAMPPAAGPAARAPRGGPKAA